MVVGLVGASREAEVDRAEISGMRRIVGVGDERRQPMHGGLVAELFRLVLNLQPLASLARRILWSDPALEFRH